MLKIGVHNEDGSTSFTVEGKLTAPSVAELEKCWQAAMAVSSLRSIVVRLAAVTFIDSESRELLTRMCRQGARLVPTGCLMKMIVEQIEAELAIERSADRKAP